MIKFYHTWFYSVTELLHDQYFKDIASKSLFCSTMKFHFRILHLHYRWVALLIGIRNAAISFRCNKIFRNFGEEEFFVSHKQSNEAIISHTSLCKWVSQCMLSEEKYLSSKHASPKKNNTVCKEFAKQYNRVVSVTAWRYSESLLLLIVEYII